MAVTTMCEPDHEGAKIRPDVSKAYAKYREDHPNPVPEGGFNTIFYMKTEWQGCVLNTGEYNGYHDSDFYAVVWDAEKQDARRVVYASTRGWSYPNSAVVDATPEVIAEWKAWGERVLAERKAAEKARTERAAEECGLTVDQYLNLKKCHGREFDSLRKLLVSRNNKRLRSEFRKSLAEQLYGWCTTPRMERKYDSPFSRKQWQYV